MQFNAINYFYFFDATTFRGKSEKMWKFCWFFVVWEVKIICFRDLLTFKCQYVIATTDIPTYLLDSLIGQSNWTVLLAALLDNLIP